MNSYYLEWLNQLKKILSKSRTFFFFRPHCWKPGVKLKHLFCYSYRGKWKLIIFSEIFSQSFWERWIFGRVRKFCLSTLCTLLFAFSCFIWVIELIYFSFWGVFENDVKINNWWDDEFQDFFNFIITTLIQRRDDEKIMQISLPSQMKSKISQTRQSFEHQPIFKLNAYMLVSWRKFSWVLRIFQGFQIFNFEFFGRFSNFFQLFTKKPF